MQETIQYEERQPKILRTLLTGLPSPSSALWSWITFGINMLLLAMALDVVYRPTVLHDCHNASFGRIGYVSDHSAKVLVREPYAHDVKVLYRSIDELSRSWMEKTLKASQPGYWLTNETDFTSVIEIDHLRADTPYEYIINTSSGNKTGTFTTPPRPGRISSFKVRSSLSLDHARKILTVPRVTSTRSFTPAASSLACHTRRYNIRSSSQA